MDWHRIILVFLVVLLTQCSNHMVKCVITDVRLVGGPTSNKGTVEIRIDNGAWETTCGENLGIHDVIVICRQLGFTGANRAITDTTYGQNSTPIKGLSCNGDETDLSECTSFPCSEAGGASCHGDGYIGCFEDDVRDRVFPLLRVTSASTSISYCIQRCIADAKFFNFVYAGVKNGDECHCGKASDDYTRHGVGSDDDCQTPCAGDPTESCGDSGYIAVFTIHVETVETTPAVVSTEKVNEVTSQPSSEMTSHTRDAVTSSTMTTPLQTLTTLQQSCNCSYVASTLAVGILLAFVTLYGIIITLIYLHLRRSNIALKQSVSDRVGQELDPYTSIDATTMKQPAYEDINATRHGNRGHTNAIEGVEYGNQRIVEQTARVKKSEPEYELPIEK